MIYAFTVPIPANTAESAPFIKTIQLPRGIAHNVQAYFPAGSAGLAKFRVMRATHQVWPSIEGQRFEGDNILFSFFEVFKINSDFVTMTIEGINSDLLHPHTPLLYLAVALEEDLFPEITLANLIKRFFKLFRLR